MPVVYWGGESRGVKKQDREGRQLIKGTLLRACYQARYHELHLELPHALLILEVRQKHISQSDPLREVRKPGYLVPKSCFSLAEHSSWWLSISQHFWTSARAGEVEKGLMRRILSWWLAHRLPTLKWSGWGYMGQDRQCLSATGMLVWGCSMLD